MFSTVTLKDSSSRSARSTSWGVMVVMLGVFLHSAVALAQPQPGDVYRDYNWQPDPYGTWQRVTGPDATDPGAQVFLPNPVNSLTVDDFEHATRAEIQIEKYQVHAGTIGQAVRFNGGSWLPISDSPHIPGSAGDNDHPSASEYLQMRYPVVDVPLASLVDGLNTFEFTAQSGTLLGSTWPQWIAYGATVRVYYDDQAKAHPTGQITSHQSGATVGENEVFQATASASSEPIEQVDFIGRYTDYNWEGDGNYRQWHHRTLRSELHNHIGTDTSGPSYEATWDNDWVPDQDQPMEVTARIVDESGLTYLTPAVTGLDLDRPYSVKMHKPYSVNYAWSARAGGNHNAKVDLTADDLSNATEAQITMTTWNGVAADEIGVNWIPVVENVGLDHDLSYDSIDVPLNLLHQGTNRINTYSDTIHHGIDVLWPGPVLMIRSELTADFDGDGDVDDDDLTDPIDGWEARFGVDLDGFNFLDWQREYGTDLSPLVAAIALPEPSSLLLVSLAGLICCSRRHR